MSYATIVNTAGMFPTFVRGGANQKPPDTLIQQFIDDVAGEIDAVLQRRFNQIISQSASFLAWIAALPLDATNILEKITRYGAAAQLGDTLATFGVTAAREQGKAFRDLYFEMLNELDARNSKGDPMASGRYDHLFDSLARTETPRPAMQAVAGGDQPSDQTTAIEGVSNVFGKFDPKGT